MSDDSDDRTASLMTPAKLAQLKVAPRAAASPAAWLDQMAADAGSGHVRRLVDLRQQLATLFEERHGQAVAASARALADALHQLDFAAVQPKGWLARATGKGKEAAAGFVAQGDRVGRAGEDLADQVRALHRKQQAQGGTVERTLVEFEVEVRAIEKIMDQGARWLQDMRGQLKTRTAAGGDAAVQLQIAQDSARCELLVGRLKTLRAACSAAQQAGEHSKAIAKSRASYVASVQQMLDSEWKAWEQKLAPIVEQAAASGSADEGIDKAVAVQQRLLAALEQALQHAGTVTAQEQALADELAALHVPLQAAA